MASTTPESPELEIGHVLFMDLVGYSQLTLEEQTEVRAKLQELVRATDQFRRADERGELIRLPSGDGMALVFLRNPVAPVRCALEIAAALRCRPELPLRMGIHSGPVCAVEDINATRAAAGGGINLAARVMDCGDAGHILLSSSIAEVLGQLRDWSGYLHDLGECEVKHGVRLRLFNLCTDELGNREQPARFGSQPAGAATPSMPDPRPAGGDPGAESITTMAEVSEAGATGTGVRVALLYRRNAQPDEQVLKLLETELGAHGYELYIDRHLTLGVEWAKSIEQELRTADVIIPLLSATSVHSEMLAYEVQIAHEAAGHREKPRRILPVRVEYTGPLPEPLAATLGPTTGTVWEGPGDDAHLVAELLRALRTPTAAPAGKLEPVGGAVPLDSKFYIVRPTDEAFRTAIARRDSIVLLKGARQMGKTSLLARGLQQAREAGAKVVLTDFQKLNESHLASAESLFLALAEWIAIQLDLDISLEKLWNPRSGANINFEWFFRREVLRKLSVPLVWGMDEVDQLFAYDFAPEVFGLFRSWHNERALDPSGPWSRLTLAIAYATEAHLFITNVNQSPFNVGTRLTLDDFTLAEVAELNHRYGSPLRSDTELQRFHRLLGGHPYLVQRGLHAVVSDGMEIARFEAEAERDEGIFGEHLRRILVVLAKNPELGEVVRGVLQGQPCASIESFYRLRSSGVMAGESASVIRPRCELYATYLKRHLL